MDTPNTPTTGSQQNPSTAPAPAGADATIFSDFFQFAPGWFAAVAAIIYGTGILVVFTFLESFGLRGVGGDFFKAKYIHIGILCLQLPLIGLLFILGCTYIISKNEQSGKTDLKLSPRQYIPSVLLFFNLLFVFFLLVLFARPGFFAETQTEIFWLFIISIFGLLLVRLMAQKMVKAHLADSFSTIGRWSGLVVALGLDVWIFAHWGGFYSFIWEVVKFGGYLFIGFVVLIGVMAFMAYNSAESLKKDDEPLSVCGQRKRFALWVVTLCMISCMFFRVY